MAYSAFLSLFHPEYQVLCTCVYQSLPGLCAMFPSAALNPDVYNTQHSRGYIHAVILAALSEHPLCHFIFCGSAHRACTCHLAKDSQCCDDSAELPTSSNSQPEISLSLCCTHSREAFSNSSGREEGKERKSSWEIHGVVEATNKSSEPNNNQVLEDYSCKLKFSNGNGSYLFYLCSHELQRTKLHLTEFCAASTKLK